MPRKCPAASATEHRTGAAAIGLDGRVWKVKRHSDGRKGWVLDTGRAYGWKDPAGVRRAALQRGREEGYSLEHLLNMLVGLKKRAHGLAKEARKLRVYEANRRWLRAH